MPGIFLATSALFWLLFALTVSSHPFTFNLFVVFCLNWVSCKQHIVKSCLFKTHLVSICRLIREFNPFAFKVITDKEGFFSAIVIFVSYVISFLFLSSSNTAFFCVWWIFFFLMHHFEFFLFPFLHLLFIFLVVTMGIVINFLNL